MNTHDEFQDLQVIFAIPEHKVPLPGGATQSQNDLFLIARTQNELVSITVEGKVSDPFGATIGEWAANFTEGKKTRLKFLKENLGLSGDLPKDIRYQLIHRSASAMIEAKKIHAKKAIMIVHSFSQVHQWYDDFARFVSLFNKNAEREKVIFLNTVDDIDFYCCWIKGEEIYLKR